MQSGQIPAKSCKLLNAEKKNENITTRNEMFILKRGWRGESGCRLSGCHDGSPAFHPPLVVALLVDVAAKDVPGERGPGIGDVEAADGAGDGVRVVFAHVRLEGVQRRTHKGTKRTQPSLAPRNMISEMKPEQMTRIKRQAAVLTLKRLLNAVLLCAGCWTIKDGLVGRRGSHRVHVLVETTHGWTLKLFLPWKKCISQVALLCVRVSIAATSRNRGAIVTMQKCSWEEENAPPHTGEHRLRALASRQVRYVANFVQKKR